MGNGNGWMEGPQDPLLDGSDKPAFPFSFSRFPFSCP